MYLYDLVSCGQSNRLNNIDEYTIRHKKDLEEIIPKAGHSIAAEKPELYIKTIIKFLNK